MSGIGEPSGRQAVLVGLFVAVALAILAGGVFTIGGLTEALRPRIAVRAVFDDVGGLQSGDAVWFAGVPVGTVRRVGFDGAQVAVELAVDSDVAELAGVDAVARIGSDGLIGNPIVVIEGDGRPDAPLSDGAELATQEGPSTEDLLASLQQNSANLVAVTEDLRAVTSRVADGEGTVGQLLSDGELYADLQDTVDGLRSASGRASAATQDLAALASAMNQPGSLPHAVATDRETWPRVTGAVERLEGAATGLERAATDPATPMGTLLHDRGAGEDLRSTFEQLDRSTALLAEDLEALQHNFLLRGYFRRRARDDARSGADGGGSAGVDEPDPAR